MATVLPLIPPDSDAIDFERRFGGIARLYGESALTSFKQAHVCVIGVGGVGSWAVEGLARSAIGKITMIDLDHLSESNVNRQLHALTDTLGKSKVDALAERIAQINPYCVVTRIEEFIDPDNVATLIPAGQFDYVIDAIDNTRAKTALVVHCRLVRICQTTECFAPLWQMMISVTRCRLSDQLVILMTIALSE